MLLIITHFNYDISSNFAKKGVKTDSIFYRLFQTFPSIFFELINQPTTLMVDYQFSSVEIKQLAFRIDGVFLPRKSDSEEPIYFLEVQFQPDSQFYRRFFAEIFLYLSRNEMDNDWRGVIIYPRRLVDNAPTLHYQELLNIVQSEKNISR